MKTVSKFTHNLDWQKKISSQLLTHFFKWEETMFKKLKENMTIITHKKYEINCPKKTKKF